MIVTFTWTERALALLALERRKPGHIYRGRARQEQAETAIRSLQAKLGAARPFEADAEELLQLHRALHWAGRAYQGWMVPRHYAEIARSYHGLARRFERRVPPVAA